MLKFPTAHIIQPLHMLFVGLFMLSVHSTMANAMFLQFHEIPSDSSRRMHGFCLIRLTF